MSAGKRGGARPMLRADDGRRAPRRTVRAEPRERPGSWMAQVAPKQWRPLPTLDETESRMR